MRGGLGVVGSRLARFRDLRLAVVVCTADWTPSRYYTCVPINVSCDKRRSASCHDFASLPSAPQLPLSYSQVPYARGTGGDDGVSQQGVPKTRKWLDGTTAAVLTT